MKNLLKFLGASVEVKAEPVPDDCAERAFSKTQQDYAEEACKFKEAADRLSRLVAEIKQEQQDGH